MHMCYFPYDEAQIYMPYIITRAFTVITTGAPD